MGVHNVRISAWRKKWFIILVGLVFISMRLFGETDAVLDVMLDVEDTAIYLDGKILGTGSCTIVKPPGEYKLTVKLPDGSEQDVKVVLLPGEMRKLKISAPAPTPEIEDKPQIEVSVKRLTGNLLVIGAYPGELIRLDGKPIGKSSLYLQGISLDAHKLHVGEEELNIIIEPTKTTLVQKGKVSLLENLAGTAVYDWSGSDLLELSEGDQHYGKLPVTIGPLADKEREWQLCGAGVQEITVNTAIGEQIVRQIVVEIEDNDTPQKASLEQTDVAVARSYGTVVIAAAGQHIKIDNAEMGLSPAVISRILAGSREIDVGGYAAKIEIKPNRITLVRLKGEELVVAEVEEIPGMVVIGGATPGLEIKLAPDREWVSLGDSHLIVGKEDQRVALRGAGYEPQELTIAVVPGKLKRVNLTAENLAAPHVFDITETSLSVARAYGEVEIITVVPGSEVILDGVAVGKTTLHVKRVLAGKRSLQIGVSATRDVEVQPDKVTVIRVDQEGEWSIKVDNSQVVSPPSNSTGGS